MKNISHFLNRSSRKPNDKLNILTGCTHEACETIMCKTGHNFYSLQGERIKVWNKTYRPIPKNYTILPPNYIPLDLDFDLVMFQTIIAQPQILGEFAYSNNIPLLRFEHTMAYTGKWPRQLILDQKAIRGLENVFITDFSRKSWLFDDDEGIVIGHAIDTDLFKPDKSKTKNGKILTVVNEFPSRDEPCGFRLYQEITRDLPVLPVGYSPGFSEPAKSVDDLINYYQTCEVFLNTSLLSPFPMSLMEAMACGCAIVTTATAAIPEYCVNGYNCYTSNDPSMLRYYVQDLLKNPDRAKKFGNNARKTVESKCSISRYVKELNNVFYRVAKTEPMYF